MIHIPTVCTRLAPSPTGFLHLGNIWAFFLCWLMARQAEGKVILRIDDIDRMRFRKEYLGAIMEDMLWLGFDWDAGPGHADEELCFQSRRNERYREVVDFLASQGLVYHCFCSRSQLKMLASAPHDDQATPVAKCQCPNLTRHEIAAKKMAGQTYSLKLRTPEKPIIFDDLFYGRMVYEKDQYGGDFPLLRADGVFAYQLASTVDDADMGVNLVCRGCDLLMSTPRQIAILEYLKKSVPKYAHIPLLLDESGERLAKRHASLSVRELRARGARPQRIIGFLAWLAGMQPDCRDLSLQEAKDLFRPELLEPEDLALPQASRDILLGKG